MKLEDTTIRDFGGGWNVADSDLNLQSKYQPLSENILRGVDGSFGPRFGHRLFENLENGTATTYTGSYSLTTTNAQVYIDVNWTAHPFVDGDHVTISGAATTSAILASEINRTHSVKKIDANKFRFYTRGIANATATASQDLTVIRDTHAIGGDIIHADYFNRRLVLFSNIGEIVTIDATNTVARIWDAPKSIALAGSPTPTRWCKMVSSNSFKSTLISCNGYDKDKPLQIKKDFTVEYLVDKSTSSNSAVPKADYVICMQGYVIFIRTEFGDAFVEMSAKNTDGTFTRDPNPSDSVEVDLSTQTTTVEPVLLGASRLRDKLYVAFYDRGMIGALGQYTTVGTDSLHQPNFDDTIAEHGTVSHRTIVPLGNDIFMCDYAGVPSVTISSQSGVYVPVRLSELIGPAIQKHLANLSEDTLREKCFALYNKGDRSYMLFVPKYDEKTTSLEADPFVFTDGLIANNQAIVYAPDHKLFTRSYVTIAGAVDIDLVGASSINGKREVVSIIDNDNFVVQLDTLPTGITLFSGGGTNVTITPINDETIGYIFEYNKELKIRRWSRYRDLNFACGCVSQRGKVFMCRGKRVYKLGDYEEPIYADEVGNYDFANWATSHVYTEDTRVLDQTNNIVYKCVVAHTSASSSTFAADRVARPDKWEIYVGIPIFWELETPWSDMRARGLFKINKYISIDSLGNDTFTVAAYLNKIRLRSDNYTDTPNRALQFTSGDVGGFGAATPQTFGSGRRTREQKLWPFPLKGKLLLWRFSGKTLKRVRIIALTMFYTLGKAR